MVGMATRAPDGANNPTPSPNLPEQYFVKKVKAPFQFPATGSESRRTLKLQKLHKNYSLSQNHADVAMYKNQDPKLSFNNQPDRPGQNLYPAHVTLVSLNYQYHQERVRGTWLVTSCCVTQPSGGWRQAVTVSQVRDGGGHTRLRHDCVGSRRTS